MRGSRVLRAGLLLVFVLHAGLAAAVIVNGTVRTSGGSALSGMTVQAWTTAGTLATQTISASSGFWSVSLPAGTYKLLAFDASGVYATDFYAGASSFDTATNVAVTECGALTGVDFALPIAGYVSGTVRAGGSPLSGIVAAAYGADGSLRTTTTTDSSGQYRLTLPPGPWRIVVYDNARAHTTQFWRATTDFDAATPVPVAAGQTAAGIDFSLDVAGVLAGTVRDARTGAPLAGIFVEMYSVAGTRLANATTGAEGGFVVAVPPGDLKVVAADPKLKYRTVYFAGASSLATATTLSARAGQTTGGIDFALPAASASSPTERWVVAAANAAGVNDTYFRTTLWVLNVSATTAHLALTWLPGGGGDNSGAVPVTRDVAPGAELALADVVASVFGAGGGGAIRVASDAPVLVASRTATPAPGGGSYGLGVPGAGPERAVVSGRIPGIRVDGAYRTNVGFVNPGPAAVTVALTLSDASGAVIAQGTVPLGAFGQLQANTIASYLGLGTVAQGTLRATAPTPFFAYATVIDQVTGDATFVAAEAD